MANLEYSVEIDAPQEKVWEVLHHDDSYLEWVKAFSENPQISGKWQEGREITFYDPQCGGTVAVIEDFTPYKRIALRHIATLTTDMKRETTGEETEKWIGSKDIYILEGDSEKTVLTIEMHTHEQFAEIFSSCWPETLANIKRIAEK